MCAVSMISDHYGRYKEWQTFPPKPIQWPQGLPTSLPWTMDSLNALKDILARLDALDKKLGLAECEDPRKAEWMKAIEDRLTKLEGDK